MSVLYRLEFENFYSIRDPQAIDLRIAESVPDVPGRFDPIFDGASERAARVAALFGPNGSGKSTVLKALSFIRWLITHSFQNAPQASVPCERFNDPAAAKEPIRLAIEFGGSMHFAGDRGPDDMSYGVWRYEVTMREQEGRTIVVAEALRQKPDGKGRWIRVFDRVGGTVKAASMFGLSGYGRVLDKVRDNASLIPTLAQFDHRPSLELIDAAMKILSNIFLDKFEVNETELPRFFASNTALLDNLNQEIQRIDLGIIQAEVLQFPSGPQLFFKHEGLERPMPWALESHGTRKFIQYFPIINDALRVGGIAVIDEIDIAIHPLILPEIVRWFHDSERNPHHAQLWMSCHAVSLLEELLKEEIFFCEKDRSGKTTIFGLQDIQNVRRTDNRYRKYLSGVYGAVPHIG